MRWRGISLLLAVVLGCNRTAPEDPEATKPMLHPQFDTGRWKQEFPLEDFEKHEGPRKFGSTKPGDPLDLWKARGEIISSPSQLSVVEQVRARAAKERNLGTTVPVDIFVWAVGEPAQPYLTKIGGLPHRPRSRPWPKARDGKPLTFVFQMSFLDSKRLISKKLPGDVMLVFFKDADSFYGKDVLIEWSARELDDPMTKADCPQPSFAVPELGGVIHRTKEYPESWEAFEQLGHYQH